MYTYLKLNEANIVIAEIYTDKIPATLPPRAMDVSGRTDGPWMGRTYDQLTDTFGPQPAQTKAALEISKLPFSYQVWQMWKDTRAEAQARSAPVNLVTALTAREDAAWNNFVNDLQEWRQAN